MGSFPNGLATSPSQGKYIYVANRDSNTVSEISLPSFAVLHTINIPIGMGGESPHPFDVVIQRQAKNGLSSHPRGQSKVMPANSRNRP